MRALRTSKREAKSSFIFVLEKGCAFHLHRALAGRSNLRVNLSYGRFLARARLRERRRRFLFAFSVCFFCLAFSWLDRGQRRPGAERDSSVGGPLAQRRGGWRQDQLRVVDDVADMTVVADEADPTVSPL